MTHVYVGSIKVLFRPLLNDVASLSLHTIELILQGASIDNTYHKNGTCTHVHVHVQCTCACNTIIIKSINFVF